MLERLETLKGKFWTKYEELIEEIEDLGFDIEEEFEDLITVYEGNCDDCFGIYLIRAGRTIAIKDIKEM